ncbi:hypothetical protein Patl1_27969 [Pistacia atlantica]|uniref:Uncharacterized protein n=1 Tax=Pistacia atlantica TaxID=434234 RepID=A0ACC1BBL1_9ROSI|nr:hypothetical protein Patl1_27969 [Pistacia atlantica]
MCSTALKFWLRHEVSGCMRLATEKKLLQKWRMFHSFEGIPRGTCSCSPVCGQAFSIGCRKPVHNCNSILTSLVSSSQHFITLS